MSLYEWLSDMKTNSLSVSTHFNSFSSTSVKILKCSKGALVSVILKKSWWADVCSLSVEAQKRDRYREDVPTVHWIQAFWCTSNTLPDCAYKWSQRYPPPRIGLRTAGTKSGASCTLYHICPYSFTATPLCCHLQALPIFDIGQEFKFFDRCHNLPHFNTKHLSQ